MTRFEHSKIERNRMNIWIWNMDCIKRGTKDKMIPECHVDLLKADTDSANLMI